MSRLEASTAFPNSFILFSNFPSIPHVPLVHACASQPPLAFSVLRPISSSSPFSKLNAALMSCPSIGFFSRISFSLPPPSALATPFPAHWPPTPTPHLASSSSLQSSGTNLPVEFLIWRTI
ncbi:hypothetical protein A0H81_10329 [Grifola frondosa]|uniref:Uncharacterized protein n=1 Tax=Grifola frondosa TaxID=5627 RepID=A0A1C7LYN2_GRIFR|nr:hypothetical protein A0H81_10329 [Grifola frondosa]